MLTQSEEVSILLIMSKPKISIKDLTIEDIADGMLKCIENTESLVEDMDYFIGINKRHRAVVFLVAILEELAKAKYLAGCAIIEPKTEVDIKNYSKVLDSSFRHHIFKQTAILNELFSRLFERAKIGYHEPSMLVSIVTESMQPLFEKGRQTGIYVEWDHKNKFLLPEQSFFKNIMFNHNFDKLTNLIRDDVKYMRKLYGNNRQECIKYIIQERKKLKVTREE